ncbi:MAG: PIN domain-containing protein [Fimbriimonadia bacterium]|nr:PIN domain-containing protein [Fimbriimonadia bacterium]
MIPAVVVAELYYLNQKQSQPIDFNATLAAFFASASFKFVDFRASDVSDFAHLHAISEMHDRMIVSVARQRNSPCLTMDRNIVESGVVTTLW